MQELTFDELPEEIKKTISQYLRPHIKKVYKDYCDHEADRYYIDLLSWIAQHDLVKIAGFKMKKKTPINSYVRIEPDRYHCIKLCYTVYLK